MAKELDDIEPHSGLQQLRTRLQNIHDGISNFQSLTAKPPILDSSLDLGPGGDPLEDGQWLQQEHIPGLKKLRDSVKIDLDVLEKVCSFFSGLKPDLISFTHVGILAVVPQRSQLGSPPSALNKRALSYCSME